MMRTPRPLLRMLAPWALALSCVESRAAIIVDATVTLASQPASPLKYRFWLQDAKLREEAFSGNIALLLDDKLVLLDSQRRNYQVIDHAMIERLSFDPERVKQKLATETANLPAAQRAWVEKRLQHLDASNPAQSGAESVHDTGRSERLEDRNYEVWERQQDGHLLVQYLVTPVSMLPQADQWQRVIETLGRLTTGINLPTELKARAPDPLGILGRAKDMVAMQAAPIVIREFAPDGTLRMQSRLRLRESSPVPDSYFTVPAGFHLVATTARATWVSK